MKVLFFGKYKVYKEKKTDNLRIEERESEKETLVIY
jgi:hypothetical protein